MVWFVGQVSRLLLLAGANPNELTELLNGAPALCIAAREGHVDLVALYLEFGADVNACDDSDVPALSYAAASGHVNIIHLLTIQHAKVCQLAFHSYLRRRSIMSLHYDTLFNA